MQEKPALHRDLRLRTIRGLIVGLLAGAIGCLLLELALDAPKAAAQIPPAAEPGRLLAVAGQITADTYGLYLVDRKSGIITIYQWSQRERKLRLLAARNTTYDLQLDEYNTEPSPKEIRQLVRKARSLSAAGSP